MTQSQTKKLKLVYAKLIEIEEQCDDLIDEIRGLMLEMYDEEDKEKAQK